MSSDELESFQALFTRIAGRVVSGYGYQFRSGHSRPRGLALEFEHAEPRLLFAVLEGGAVTLDLILRESDDRSWRIAINQALWFSGIRAVAQKAPPADQCELFAREIPRCCHELLQGDLTSVDPRFCFPMSALNTDRYLLAQRGH